MFAVISIIRRDFSTIRCKIFQSVENSEIRWKICGEMIKFSYGRRNAKREAKRLPYEKIFIKINKFKDDVYE